MVHSPLHSATAQPFSNIALAI